jgi:hypothetical protein
LHKPQCLYFLGHARLRSCRFPVSNSTANAIRDAVFDTFRRENTAGSPPLLFPVPPIHLSDGQLCGQRRGILRAVLSELLPAGGNLIKPVISPVGLPSRQTASSHQPTMTQRHTRPQARNGRPLPLEIPALRDLLLQPACSTGTGPAAIAAEGAGLVSRGTRTATSRTRRCTATPRKGGGLGQLLPEGAECRCASGGILHHPPVPKSVELGDLRRGLLRDYRPGGEVPGVEVLGR